MDYSQLNEIQLDALREVGNIGAAHAATALSQILGKTIWIGISRVKIFPLKDLVKIVGGPRKKVFVVSLKVLGDVLGGLMLVFEWKNALALSAILRTEPQGSLNELSEMDISGLKETGSILSAAYLRAIGDMTKMALIPTVPDTSCGEFSLILQAQLSGLSKRAEIAFCIETQFVESSRTMEGHFLLIPEVKSLEMLLNALGLFAKDDR